MLILHHLGLGDHIICNGLVRGLYDRAAGEACHLFCKPHNETSVKFMYEDLSKLEIHIGGDADAFSFQKQNPHIPSILIGFSRINLNSGVAFDEQFYNHANLSFNKRWDDFYCRIDSRVPQQSQIFKYYKDKYNIKRGEYIFVHDDKSRNLDINEDLIKKNNSGRSPVIIRPEKGITDNIFDFYMLMRWAKEVHCIDSSFKHMAESLFENQGNTFSFDPIPDLYYHTYVRGNDSMHVASSRLQWRHIKIKDG